MAYDRNEYLLENYGTTLARYNEMDAEQGHRCKCCGQVPTGKPLHVDHCHKIAKLKIKVRLEIDGVWRAVVVSFGQGFEAPPGRDVQAVQRPEVRGETDRRGRSVPQSSCATRR